MKLLLALLFSTQVFAHGTNSLTTLVFPIIENKHSRWMNVASPADRATTKIEVSVLNRFLEIAVDTQLKLRLPITHYEISDANLMVEISLDRIPQIEAEEQLRLLLPFLYEVPPKQFHLFRNLFQARRFKAQRNVLSENYEEMIPILFYEKASRALSFIGIPNYLELPSPFYSKLKIAEFLLNSRMEASATQITAIGESFSAYNLMRALPVLSAETALRWARMIGPEIDIYPGFALALAQEYGNAKANKSYRSPKTVEMQFLAAAKAEIQKNHKLKAVWQILFIVIGSVEASTRIEELRVCEFLSKDT